MPVEENQAPGFRDRITDGMAHASEHVLLAVVPILLSLLDTNKIASILTFDGGHIGFKLGLPLSVVTIWQFVSVPSSGVSFNAGLPVEQVPYAVVSIPVILVGQAALTAGYFGSIRNVLDDEPYGFLRSIRAYFVPFFVLTALPALAALPFVIGAFGIGTVAGNFGGVTILLLLVTLFLWTLGAYLLYATPYILVLNDVGVIEAARQSYSLAIQGGPYLSYALKFALFVLVVSVFATGIVVNVPLMGIPLGILTGGYIGLGVNFATMDFVADLTQKASRSPAPDSEARNDEP